MSNRGTPVIGLGERTPEYEALPLQWMPHLQVHDVGASTARALQLGGRELMHGRDEDGRSQWAVLVDPAGAAFGLIPVVEADSEAADDPEGAGRIAWLTLVVADVSPVCGFYEQVIGWSAAPTGTEGEFEMRRPDGVASAEIRRAGEGDRGVPAVWLISLPVGDLEESLRLVAECGGELIQGSADSGRAVVGDPVGVVLALQSNR
jgi:predicted enzyme related to lactoylglutathione lyase